MSLRPLSPDGIPVEAPATDFGAAPLLQWIKLAELVVDDAYQRPIGRLGKRTIQRIAAEFAWSRFAPVIVSPVEGGLYAIVDGQHRATAAALVGIAAVPCQVIVASVAEQAASFSAINGNVTRIHRMALHRAAVAAGEAGAVTIERVAVAAGVRILRYPKSELNQEPGETMAVAAIERAVARHGEATVVLALRAVVETRNRVKGGLLGPIITAVTEAVAKLPAADLAEPGRVIAAFERINVIREYGLASAAKRPPGMPIATALAGRLSAALRIHLAVAA